MSVPTQTAPRLEALTCNGQIIIIKSNSEQSQIIISADHVVVVPRSLSLSHHTKPTLPHGGFVTRGKQFPNKSHARAAAISLAKNYIFLSFFLSFSSIRPFICLRLTHCSGFVDLTEPKAKGFLDPITDRLPPHLASFCRRGICKKQLFELLLLSSCPLQRSDSGPTRANTCPPLSTCLLLLP